MSGKRVLLILSGATLLYLGYKAFAGNGLIGSANSGKPGSKYVPQVITDEEKTKLLGELSTLEAKINGGIPTTENIEQLKMQYQNVLQKLK